MALTQISTAGVKDDAVTSGKIPANAVGSSELADNAVDTAAIANGAVSNAKIVDGAINNAKVVSDAAIAGSKISPSFTSSLSVNTGTINTCATFTSTDAGAVVNLTDNSARSSIEQNGTDLKIISDTDASHANSTLKFSVDNSTKMTLNSSGNLGIGTTSPSSILTTEQSAGNINLELHATGSGRGSQVKCHNDHGTAYLGLAGNTDGELLIYQETNAPTLFHTNGQERMRLLAGGGLTFNGDTAAANALDDYEEGTATFTLRINGGSWSGATIQYNTAPYIKIGKLVFCQISMFATNLDNTTGNVEIGGLPFTEGGGGGYREPAFIAGNHPLGTSPSVIFGAIAGGGTHIALRKAGSSSLNGSDLGGTFWMHGSVTYTST